MALAVFNDKTFSKTQFIIGVLQFATMWSLLGYLWSIAWGLLIVWKAVIPQCKILTLKLIATTAQPQAASSVGGYDTAQINPFENNAMHP